MSSQGRGRQKGGRLGPGLPLLGLKLVLEPGSVQGKLCLLFAYKQSFNTEGEDPGPEFPLIAPTEGGPNWGG